MEANLKSKEKLQNHRRIEVMPRNKKERGRHLIMKHLEYTKKIALIRKLFRIGLLSEKEYNKARRKLMDMYLMIEANSDCQRVSA